jgi:hypothetical protein
MGIFRQLLQLGQQLLAKLDDIDVQVARGNTHLSEIEGELDKLNRNIQKLVDGLVPKDIASFGVRVDKPIKQ